jgi:hypothetical protein
VRGREGSKNREGYFPVTVPPMTDERHDSKAFQKMETAVQMTNRSQWTEAEARAASDERIAQQSRDVVREAFRAGLTSAANPPPRCPHCGQELPRR